MEQESYKYEIVDLLLRGRSHAREIAKILKTNHMTISRRIRELYDENVIDFLQQGKNKAYYLKNSAEARSHIFMTENYKLARIIKIYPLLRMMIERLQKDSRFGLAVLFGSYAKKTANKTSDIDIYIETEDLNLKKELTLYDSKVSIKIGIFNKENNLIQEIIRNHVIIKGIEEFYDNTQFFVKDIF
jgi:predicted nucleotidyltransferase